jgi:hypothetical protein
VCVGGGGLIICILNVMCSATFQPLQLHCPLFFTERQNTIFVKFLEKASLDMTSDRLSLVTVTVFLILAPRQKAWFRGTLQLPRIFCHFTLLEIPLVRSQINATGLLTESVDSSLKPTFLFVRFLLNTDYEISSYVLLSGFSNKILYT